MAPQPRPYIVRCRDRDGEEHVDHALAYDLQEAMHQASVLIAERGPGAKKFLSIEPDVEALKAGTDEETERGLEWSRAVGRNVGEQ